MAARKDMAAIAVRGRTWEWALAGDSAGGGRFEVTLPEGATELRMAILGAGEPLTAAFRAAAPRLSPPIAIGLPADWVVLRILDLPPATGDDLRDMVTLQVDKFSPFAAEDTVVACEVLHAGEASQSVLVAVLQNAVAEALRALCQAADWRLTRIDLVLLGWWRLLRESRHVPETGCHVILLHDRAACDAWVVRDGVPIAVRAFGDLTALPPAEAADEVVRETMFALAGAIPGAGAEAVGIDVWHDGAEAPAVLVAHLRERFGLAPRTTSMDTLPAVAGSLAARAADAAPGVDLAPPAWREASRLRLRQRHLLAAVAGIAAVWLATMAILYGGPIWLQRDVDRRQAQVDALKPGDKATRATRDSVQTLEQYLNRTYSALETLREVSRTLPPGIELRSFTYRKGKQVEVNGEAQNVGIVYDFKKELDASDLFVKGGVALPKVQHLPRGGESFKITAVLPGGKRE